MISNAQTGTLSDEFIHHQQVTIIIIQVRGGTTVVNAGTNYNTYTTCFICGWQMDGSVAF